MPKDAAYLEAEKKIEKAWVSGATELDLSNMGLTELPEAIEHLKQLQSEGKWPPQTLEEAEQILGRKKSKQTATTKK